MTTKLNWRLSKLPTPSEVTDLVHSKIITQDEAREILFSLETEESRDIESLKSEIKFLRELVEKLSDGKMSKIVETIRIIEKPYYQQPWVQPYQTWCTGSTGTTALGNVTTSGSVGGAGIAYYGNGSSTPTANFSSINTF